MILVAGGTGTLGQRLVPLLVARDMAVRVLARHTLDAQEPRLSGLETVTGDIRDPLTLERSLAGVDTLVSAITGFGGPAALGTRAVDREGNVALIDTARRAGVKQVVLMSVSQAGPSHPIALFRDKWAAEEALRASGLSWTIIRPTAYLETWLGLMGGPLVKTGTARIFGRGQNPINFVSARDVARIVELAIVDPALRETTIEVAGPQNLTLDQLVDTVVSVTGRRGRRQHAPSLILRMASKVIALANPVLSGQIATAVYMDTHDMTADGEMSRSGFPSIPMTTATEVAAELFGSAAKVAQPSGIPSTAPDRRVRQRG
jgi:uncharacterized protein YbjT (DUF2867 family)